jgi:hypothetical protein
MARQFDYQQNQQLRPARSPAARNRAKETSMPTTIELTDRIVFDPHVTTLRRGIARWQQAENLAVLFAYAGFAAAPLLLAAFAR